MEQIVVKGPTILRGEVSISGAKNAALPLLASSLLTTDLCIYKNLPVLEDIVTMSNLLHFIGAKSQFTDDHHTLAISTQKIQTTEVLGHLVKAIRASIVLLGPLLARYGQASISFPGGDAIGTRPIDQHLQGLKAMGATISVTEGAIYATAKRLHGANIYLEMPTVTGTENLMMAATLAKGITVLDNAAREPEIQDLAQALCQMGARIEGAGTSVIQIEGVDELKSVEHTIIPDRIEAGTFLVAAMMCQGDVMINQCNPAHLETVLTILRQAGAAVTTGEQWIRLKGPECITPFHVTTQPYPGFPTDLQAQFLTLACLAQGTSTMTENIFENRYMHVAQLVKMGANIKVEGRLATIFGVSHLKPAHVKGSDLRASATLVLAGLRAQGETIVEGIDHLDRGYERMEEKLQKLGAAVDRKVLKTPT